MLIIYFLYTLKIIEREVRLKEYTAANNNLNQRICKVYMYNMYDISHCWVKELSYGCLNAMANYVCKVK